MEQSLFSLAELGSATPLLKIALSRGQVIELLEENLNGQTYLVQNLPTTRDIIDLTRHVKGKVYAGEYFTRHNYADRYVLLIKHHVKKDNKKIDVLEDLTASRRSVQSLIGVNPGWTYTAMARNISMWLDIQQKPLPEELTERFFPTWHFQACLPGTYPALKLYDLKSAYWQMTKRLKSPLLTPDFEAGRIRYRPLLPGQFLRWHKMIDTLEKHKRLRLAVIGNNAAGWRDIQAAAFGTRLFEAGQEDVRYAPRPGPLQAASLMAVRLTYEAVQLAWEDAESRHRSPIYANADCIATEKGANVPPWDDLKLEYTLKGDTRDTKTPADVRATSIYRIGLSQTGSYDAYAAAAKFCHTHPQKLQGPLFLPSL